jgi:tetratricopeptide (TPR) repeat protein
MMMMTRPNPSAPHVLRRGRALWIGLALVALLLAAATGLVLFLRPAPVEQACSHGEWLLQTDQPERAAQQFRRAIELDPASERAWNGLLRASPTLAVCRQFALHNPQVFDYSVAEGEAPRQPVRDPALLVRDRTTNISTWRESLALYEGTVLASAASADPDAQLLRLDARGRRQLSRAWDEVRQLRAALAAELDRPLRPDQLRPFTRYDLPACRDVIAAAVAEFDDAKQWLALLARIGAAIEQHRDGLDSLRAAAAREPRFVPTALTLAYVDLARGTPKDAAERCRTLLAAYQDEPAIPGEARIRYCLARALELQGDPSGAVFQVRRILVRHPRDVPALLRLGRLYLELDRIDEADRIANDLMQRNELDNRPTYIRGLVSFRRGQYEAAVAQLSTAVQEYPQDLHLRYVLAQAKQRAGLHVAAAREFIGVARRTPEGGWPLTAAAAAALAAGDGKTAEDTAGTVLLELTWLDAEPRLRDFALRFKLAGTALGGRYDVMDHTAYRLRERATDRALADYLLAGAWAGQAFVSAEAPIRLPDERLDAFPADANRPSAVYCRAFLLAARGERDAARSALESLVESRPRYLLAVLHLARLYLLDGRSEQAAHILRRAGGPDPGPELARARAAIDALQGLTVRAEPQPAEPGGSVVGPHLALFALAVSDNPVGYARKILTLDPVHPAGHHLLRHTYPHIRAHGLDGLDAAVRADPAAAAAVRWCLADYQADGGRMARLVVGPFWDELPPDL